MIEAWIPLMILAAVGAAAGWYAFGRRATPVAYADEREERLTRAIAREVGCSPGRALPFVRLEIELSPHQPDATLVKRAAYHYRQDLPVLACRTYRDRAPG